MMKSSISSSDSATHLLANKHKTSQQHRQER